jgi:hypothetical protein
MALMEMLAWLTKVHRSRLPLSLREPGPSRLAPRRRVWQSMGRGIGQGALLPDMRTPRDLETSWRLVILRGVSQGVQIQK